MILLTDKLSLQLSRWPQPARHGLLFQASGSHQHVKDLRHGIARLLGPSSVPEFPLVDAVVAYREPHLHAVTDGPSPRLQLYAVPPHEARLRDSAS